MSLLGEVFCAGALSSGLTGRGPLSPAIGCPVLPQVNNPSFDLMHITQPLSVPLRVGAIKEPLVSSEFLSLTVSKVLHKSDQTCDRANG